MTVRLASCSCGQLQTQVRGDPIRVSVCHCYACQRRTGSVFSAQANFPRESVAIKGNGTKFVRVGDEGGRFRFTFCPKCGSTVFYVEEGDEQEIAIPVGAFADSQFPGPTVSVYEERRHSWVSVPDDVEHWRTDPSSPDTIVWSPVSDPSWVWWANQCQASKIQTVALGGADILKGEGGNDKLLGGVGNDKVVGSGGSDFLYGEDGADAPNSKDGVNGNDTLDGGAGGTDTKITDTPRSR